MDAQSNAQRITILRELNRRKAELNPQQSAIVDELNRRLGITPKSDAVAAAELTRKTLAARYPQLQEQPASPSALDNVGNFLYGAVAAPVVGLYEAGKRIVTPPETARDKALAGIMGPLGPLVGDVVQSHVETGKKWLQSVRDGEYLQAGGYALATMLPMVGPAAAATAEKIADPRTRAEGYGEAVSNIATSLIPGAAAKPKKITVVPKFQNPNAAEAAAAGWAIDQGINVPASVATGNTFVKGLQKVADTTPLGSIVAQNAEQAVNTGLRRVSGELAERVNRQPVTPEQAGAGMRGTLEGRVRELHSNANVAYGELQKLEQDPANFHTVWVGDDPQTGKPVYQEMALPVDMRPVKKALAPIYSQLMRSMPIAQRRASAGFLAIENIIGEGDFKPASIAEMDLGAIKEAARTNDLPQLRNVSQGLAAKAVAEFDQAIRRAIAAAKRSEIVDNSPALGAGSATIEGVTDAPRTGTLVTRGTQTTVKVPGENKAYGANYAVRELDEIQASHDGGTFQRNPNYAFTNDRDYARAENQGSVVEWSTPAGFDPAYLVSDQIEALGGPPVVDAAGNALGGNGRTMILQRVYSGNPKGAAAYRSMLTEKAAQFGVDPEAIQGMKRPVLVRVVPDSELSRGGGAQTAITDFNKTGTKALRPSERAISDSRRVSQSTLDDLAGRLEAAGPDASLADVLDGKAGTEVLQRLVDDGVISSQELGAFRDGNILTPDGRKRISSLMLGRFFEDAAQLDAVPDVVRKRLERIAAPLAKLEGTPFALTDTVRGALSLIEEARGAGAATLDDFLNQGGLFGDSRYSPDQVRMAKQLRNAKSADLVKMAREYADDAAYASGGAGLFGDVPTPESAFASAFGREVVDAADALEDAAPAASAAAAAESSPQTTAVVPARPQAPVVRIAPPKVAGVSAGNDAMFALTAGRRATAKKWEIADVLKQLRDEPVQAFDQATWSRDAGIERLRELARHAPDDMSRVGRAYLDNLLERATSQGGFNNAGALWQSWQNLGPETKKILFRNPGLIEDLDKFFLVAKKIGENPNPSGSAVVGWIGAQGAIAITHPVSGIAWALTWRKVSQLLHSPKGAKLLTEGLQIPLGNKARAASVAAQLLNMAGQDKRAIDRRKR